MSWLKRGDHCVAAKDPGVTGSGLIIDAWTLDSGSQSVCVVWQSGRVETRKSYGLEYLNTNLYPKTAMVKAIQKRIAEHKTKAQEHLTKAEWLMAWLKVKLP